MIGWAFKEWTGDHTGTDNPATFHVDGEEEVTAVFEEVELTVDTEGKGVVHIDPPDITPEEEEYPHTEKYAAADPQEPPKVDLAASPTDANWGFKEWTGDVEPTAATLPAIEIEMDAAKSVTAVFEQVEVTITIEGNGSVSTAPTGEAISETKKGFAYGAEVAFTATADAGWAFKEWSGAITGAETTTTSDPLLEDTSVTAVFEQIALTVDTEGTGKVTISPPIVTPDVEEYPHTEVYPLSTPEDPQSVTLTAVEVANWGFKEWTGDVEGPTDTLSITIDMDAEKTVTAVFEQAVLTSSTTGEGSVSRDPGGAFIAANKSGHAPGALVEVEATPAANWGFKEWTGAINTTDNPAEVEMDGDQSVTAVFYQVELTVTKTGEGEVTTTPYGNTEEPTFTEKYAPGETVVVKAVPEDGWFFAGWSGGAGGASATVQVTMTEDKTVHALFERIELTVQKQGQGNVTASPPGGQVSVPFTEGYNTGQQVTLHATPAPGWGFKQWMGDLNPSGTTATTIMNTSKTVTAVFAQSTLHVDKDGEGTVSVSPPGGVQTLPFSEKYPFGNGSANLSATASLNWYFDRWEGDVPTEINGDPTISLDFTQHRSVTAIFTECETDITLMAIRFTDTADVRGFPSGELLSNGYHYSKYDNAPGPIAPVRYGFNATPTINAEFWVQSSDCTELIIRAKLGSAIIGQKSTNVGNSPRLVSVTNLGGQVEIPTHDMVGKPTTNISFEYSTDNEKSWHSIGSGGPSTWYIMPDTNTFNELPFDLAFEKIVEYAGGSTEADDIATGIMEGVDSTLKFNASQTIEFQHILELYEKTEEVSVSCVYHSILMTYLCLVSGTQASQVYIFGGANPTVIDHYVYGPYIPSMRLVAPAKEDEPSDPHYEFHVQVLVNSQFYDPAYGRKGTAVASELAPPYSAGGVVPPVQGLTIYTPILQTTSSPPNDNQPPVNWTCPH